MTQTDFFNKTRDILLFKDNSGIFRYRLKKALDEYSKVAKEASVKPEVLSDIHYISQRLKEIVSNYEKGLQSKAYSQLQNLIQGNKKIAPKIDLAKTILPFDAG